MLTSTVITWTLVRQDCHGIDQVLKEQPSPLSWRACQHEVNVAAFSNLVSISQLPARLPDNNLETHIKSLPLFN